jgi:CelD/BcsL family acetyltransferase involved in cellulose biosynthesis
MDFKLYTSFPEELEAEWNDLLDHSVPHVPFLRHEYQSAWSQTRGGGEWPQIDPVVVTARQDGRLIGIAPLFHVPNHQGRPALLPLGAIEISDYLDVVARPEDRPAFLSGLLPFLAHAPIPAWQALDFYNVLESSSTLPALEAAAKENGWSYRVERLQHSPYIPLPGDWETYLAGIDKKQRHEIRRKMRRLEENDLPVRWYVVDDSLSLESELEAFIGLMAQDTDKARFLTAAMRDHMRLTVRCAYDRGCLNLAFLEIGGIKAAGYLSFDYLNRIWVYNSGIDFRFVEHSPGWVLLGYLLRWANEQHFSEFDFMRGDEKYKYRFGAIDRFVMRATVERS